MSGLSSCNHPSDKPLTVGECQCGTATTGRCFSCTGAVCIEHTMVVGLRDYCSHCGDIAQRTRNEWIIRKAARANGTVTNGVLTLTSGETIDFRQLAPEPPPVHPVMQDVLDQHLPGLRAIQGRR